MARVTVDFSETTVFVAGGTSGINFGIAEAFATAGARVAVMSRSKEKVDAAVARLQALGAPAIGGAADVRDPEATRAVLELAHKAFGDIDVLVSGAAGNFPAAALDMSPNAFRSVVDIDLLGSYHVLRAAYPLLRKPGAVVINVSAPQAFLPMATAVTRLCRQSRCRHDDPSARHRMGRRWHPDQFGCPWCDRGHRGHGSPVPDARGSSGRPIDGTRGPLGSTSGRRQRLPVPRIASCGLRHRRRPGRRRRLVTWRSHHRDGGVQRRAANAIR